jgi:hypothetical protein
VQYTCGECEATTSFQPDFDSDMPEGWFRLEDRRCYYVICSLKCLRSFVDQEDARLREQDVPSGRALPDAGTPDAAPSAVSGLQNVPPPPHADVIAEMWRPSESAPQDGTPFRAYGPALVDLDFNPNGQVEACFDGERFIGAVWNGQSDIWNTAPIEFTHWSPFPDSPLLADRLAAPPPLVEQERKTE